VAHDAWPFVGPRPFERKDESFFFGRDDEANELVSLIVAHQEVLLYAKSGTGKTSLLNARLISLLEREGFEVLPTARVFGLVPIGILPQDISNLYIFNIVRSWAVASSDLKSLAQMSFVQFLSQRMRQQDRRGPKPCLVILDQFEEFFSLYEERAAERDDFFAQIAVALAADRRLRVLLIQREDTIGQLARFASILPDGLRARFRLELLQKPDALSAITGPLEATGWSFEDGVAEDLLTELLQVRVETATGEVKTITGEYVEPVQLQIVCQNLGTHLPKTIKVIKKEHLVAFGDVSLALSRFYENALRDVAESASMAEGELRQWIETWLITATGTRGFLHREPRQTKGLPNKVLDLLENAHILRLEPHAGATWYELTHDRFIEPILSSNESWRNKKAEEINPLIDEINKRRQAGELKEALELCLRTVTVSREAGSAVGVALGYSYLGDVYYSQREFSKARDAFNESLVYKGDEKKLIYYNLYSQSDVCFSMELFEEAIQYASEAIALDPSNPRAYRSRAAANWYSSRLEDALQDYNHLLRLGEHTSGTFNGLGHVLAELGEYKQAVEQMGRAIKLKHDKITEAYCRNGRALAYGGLGWYVRALKEFDASLRLAPNNAWTFFNRAVTYEWMGKRSKAAADFRTALDMKDPALPPVKRQYAKNRFRKLDRSA
jgi:tetratricopeptide (TPR) repeat protein